MVYRSGPMPPLATLLERAAAGGRIDDGEALALLDAPLEGLLESAGARRDGRERIARHVLAQGVHPAHGLCRDVCHYCTFASPPRRGTRVMSTDEVLAIAHAGGAAGCPEALFTLGDKPELRYGAARKSSRRSDTRGRSSTSSDVRAVLRETAAAACQPRRHNARTSRCCATYPRRGRDAREALGAARATRRPALGSPDKDPSARLERRAAGELACLSRAASSSASARPATNASTHSSRFGRWRAESATCRKPSCRTSAHKPDTKMGAACIPIWPNSSGRRRGASGSADPQ